MTTAQQCRQTSSSSKEDVTREVLDGLDYAIYPEPERRKMIQDEVHYRIGLSFRRAAARRAEEEANG